jgi:4'-phosphopantetheinyl transferase
MVEITHSRRLEKPQDLRPETGSSFCHAWLAYLDQPLAMDMEPLLSRDEKERVERFHFDLHRHRFVGCRGTLREILAAYLDTDPRALAFRYGFQGKPSLPRSGLWFNLAHAEDLAMFAVSDRPRIGVDLEWVRDIPEMDLLVKTFFSPNEARDFSILTARDKRIAFFRLWTRKEAWLKATGAGISHLLGEVEVSFLEDEPPRIKQLPRGFGNPEDWRLFSWEPVPGYIAALATPAGGAEPVLGDWREGGQEHERTSY